jgi:hypothetical protein
MNNTANNKKPLILFIALGLIVGIVYLAIFKSIPRLTDSGFHSFKNYLTIGLTTSYTCLMIALAFDGKNQYA